MLGFLSDPLALLMYLVALVIAITVHEFAHAYAADQLGDPTPRLQGRLTLNPLAHLDPLGTLMLFLVRFGWGKPVQFDPYNLRQPQRDAAIISIAGPIANMIIAIIAAVGLRIITTFLISSYAMVGIVGSLLQTIILLNVVLAVFNLVPIHPLDGFKIVGGLLPKEKAAEWYSLERYGYIFLFLLLFPILTPTAPIQMIISPIINSLLKILLTNNLPLI